MTHALPDTLPTAGELTLTTERRACFGEHTVSLQLAWSASDARLLVGDQERPLPREQVVALAARLLAAAVRAEVTHGGRSTTSHHAHLRWRLLDAPGAAWTEGEQSFLTRDLPPADIRELAGQRPDLAARFPADPYTRAIGLHELATAIASDTARAGDP